MDQNLGRPEITNCSIFPLEQNVMGLDIPMADSLGVDIEQSPEYLVGNHLDIEICQSSLVMLLDIAVQITVVMRHNDVQILLIIIVGDVSA